ncbi:MAG TPA: MFS transporter [Burkholderiales bacterium]|nr:MFS transporter [Burkholderiales bacterium]
MNLPHGLRALRHRDFRLFFAGQGISQIGTWLQLIATSWLVYRLSDSAFMLGLAAFAMQIPFLVLAPIAGVLVDRLDRRRVLLVTNCIASVQAVLMFTVVALGVVEPWHLIVGNLVLGIVNACDAPARQSILIQLVGGRHDLANAIALNSIMMNLARFVGPMVGGVLIAALGERWGFAANALSYMGMLWALSRIQTRPSGFLPLERGLLRQLAAGARYAYGFLPARSALLLLTAVSVTVGSYVALMPWFAREAFHGDSGTLGLLISSAGLGALTGMFYLAVRTGVRGLFGLIGWTSTTAGAALLVFSFATTLWLALPALYCVGLGMMLTAASTNTVLQTIVPDELRGRVASLYVMSFIGMSPLGALAAGWVAERFGPPATLGACGMAALAASGVYASRLRAIRREIRPVYERLGA